VTSNQFNTPIQSNTLNNFNTIEESLLKDSLNTNVRLDLASKYYTQQNFEKALFHFLKVSEIEPKNLIALINIGNIYYDTQVFDKAIIYYDKALTIDNNNINVKCDKATCYLNSNMPDKAIEILKENIKQDYNHAQSHHNLSVIYRQLGKNKEADEELLIFNKLNIN
jgi:tetratricopeptide (TPR) repeat protein